ncbi:MAG: M36 family metallopeptidase [Rhizobacter sp.]|nr:M36 family metallopeptidase [Rhizobacter sp.]
MKSASKQVFAVSAVAAALMSAGFAMAQGPAGLDRSAAKVTRAEGGRPLTAASKAAPAEVVVGHLRSRGHSEALLASLHTTRSGGGANGVTHVRMGQVVGGLVVHGAYVKAAVNARGELVQVIDRLAAVSTPAASRVAALGALQTASARLHPGQAITFRRTGSQGNDTTFDGGAFFHSEPTVTAVAVPMSDGSLARGWLVQTWTEKTNLLHHTLIGGDGSVLDVESRTASDSYNVFVEDPLKGPQAIVNGPAPGGASPSGWLGTGRQKTTKIVGNNVSAYLDVDANNRADAGGTAVRGGNFLTAADLMQAPTTTGNLAVAVQNLFYLSNRAHDTLFNFGFDEAAGNFQATNFGPNGAGNDAVLAEAHDGSGTDNANFSTPPDGQKPRMQMYLWTGAGPSHEVVINSPAPSKTYGAMGAQFGPALSTTGITGAVVTASPADGCTTIASVTGKVALIDRGTCAFTIKVKNAQLAGATGVVMANNTGGTAIFTMGGTDASITIPSVMISQNDGANLKAIPSPNATERKLAVQPLQIDASIDADVVFHEYGHGLSWRMIGSMSGPIAGAIGEGNSDGIAMLINGDDRIGEYSSSNPNGIRRYPYAGYPLTYADVTGAEVHNDGEPYAAIVWRMMELFGPTRRDALFRYVVDGMNFTPATPAYENMRDGILGSVAAGLAPADCHIVWQAFAQFGVGVGAKGVVNPGGTTVTITPSFIAPTTCP